MSIASSEWERYHQRFSETSTCIERQIDNKLTEGFLSISGLLEQLVVFSEEVVLAYATLIGEFIEISSKEKEDLAFAYFQLNSIADLLDRIILSKDRAQIIAQVLENTVVSSAIITPPDNLHFPVPKNRSEHKAAKSFDRLERLIFILLENRIGVENIAILQGAISNKIYRTQPYYRIHIPTLSRVIYLCNEEENETFVFDCEQLEKAGMEIEKIDLLSKNEKKRLLFQYPGLGGLVRESNQWKSRMTDLLFSSPWVAAGKQEFQRKDEVVILDESSFYRDQAGKQWASVYTLSLEIGLHDKTLRRWVGKYPGLPQLRAQNKFGVELTVYCKEDIESLPEVIEYFATPNVEREGEWEGFYIEGERHFGLLHNLAQRIGCMDRSLIKFLPQLKQTRVVRNPKSGVSGTAYSLEELLDIPALKETLDLPLLLPSNEWDLVLIDNFGKHWTTHKILASKIGMTKAQFSYLLKKNPDLRKKRAKSATLRPTTLYCYEEVLTLLGEQ